MTKLDSIKHKVGKPYYSDDKVLLYNIDCVEFMNRMGLPIVNLTVTSPPYNIGKEYEEIQKPDRYLHWCKTWLNKIFNITCKWNILA